MLRQANRGYERTEVYPLPLAWQPRTHDEEECDGSNAFWNPKEMLQNVVMHLHWCRPLSPRVTRG